MARIMKEPILKPVVDRDNADLLELVCQLHARTLSATGTKEMHDAYVEAREELDKRLEAYNTEYGELEVIGCETAKDVCQFTNETKAKIVSIVKEDRTKKFGMVQEARLLVFHRMEIKEEVKENNP